MGVAFREGGEWLASRPRCEGSHVLSTQFLPECRSDSIPLQRQGAIYLPHTSTVPMSRAADRNPPAVKYYRLRIQTLKTVVERVQFIMLRKNFLRFRFL